MSFSEVIRLWMAAAVLTLFTAGYFFVYKLIGKGEKTVDFWNLFWGALLVCYIVIVLGATMFSRSEAARGSIRLQPLASYRGAWNCFSDREWRNLFLNILMFVPFGFMLPLAVPVFQTFWKTYLAGFLFTLLIETSQILFHRGVFELDDIMNNFLGAVIGYGFYRFLRWLLLHFRKSAKKERFRPVLLLQLPFVLTAAAWAGVFLIYHFQELGNLASSYTVRYNPDRLEVALEAVLSEETVNAPVYRAVDKDGEISYEKYKDYEILSEQGAYDQICMGRFRYFPEQAANAAFWIDVHSVQLVYETDSKGFLQPVYEFQADINQKPASIRIPAISR